MFDYDYIIIGSGFGGSVMALRLVEKGYKVALLERGREYKMHDFPRRSSEIQRNLFWDPEEKRFGFMEFLNNPDSDVATLTASGVGGGSLIYANVLYRMPEKFFHNWPYNINRQRLDPYYDRVLDMMEAKPYPLDDGGYYADTPKAHILRSVAAKMPMNDELERKPEFFQPNLAVRFEGAYPGEQTKNKHGATQSSCNKCGECDIGCNIHAKNSLDLNYLFRARSAAMKHPLELKTHAQVTNIIPLQDGYEVQFMNPLTKEPSVLKTAKVVVSAGSVGSTALLLKMKKKGHLAKLSNRLGAGWSGNGDLLGFVINCKSVADPTKGPVITGAIEHQYKPYPDGFPHGFYIEDAGYPVWLSAVLNAKAPHPQSLIHMIKVAWMFLKQWFLKKIGLHSDSGEINLGEEFDRVVERDDFFRKAFVLLGMGRDRSDGHIVLREKDNQAITKWNMEGSQLHFDRLRTQMKKMAEIMGGEFVDNPLTWLNKIIAVHPLGGCTLGETAESGVVSSTGEAYGYKGLYIVDGSVLPTSAGVNPSLTIAAMAEYFSEQIPSK